MPSYLACHCSTGKAKSRHSSSRASTIRADLGSARAGLGQNRLAILARLAQVDVHGVHVVALVLQPAQDDRGIQPPEYANTQLGMMLDFCERFAKRSRIGLLSSDRPIATSGGSDTISATW